MNANFRSWLECQLKELSLTPTAFARESGTINQPTLQRILSGETGSPGIKVITKIELAVQASRLARGMKPAFYTNPIAIDGDRIEQPLSLSNHPDLLSVPRVRFKLSENASMPKDESKVAGGVARAKKLTPELLPIITQADREVLVPVQFRTPTGGKGEGFKAEVLPTVCEIYLRANDTPGTLAPPQFVIAKQCELILRGIARVGIAALVDEATGYQEVRDKKALQAILDRYLAKELAAWAKRFPDEFYQQMFRLKGWPFNPLSVAKPGVVGKYTVDLIYERLAPGLVEQLEKANPKTESGTRKSRHHQWLSSDVGHPALAQHLHAVIGFMRACSSWEQFLGMLDRAFPKKGHTIPLLLE